MIYRLNLHLFDEEMSVGADAPVGDAANTEVSAEAQTTADTEQTTRPSFKDLIKGDYKEEADAYIQGLMNRRFKANKDNEAIMAKQKSILDVVGAKYGINDDLDGLLEKVKGDDSYYEEKAFEEGMTVENYRKFAEAQAKNREYEAQAQRIERERKANETVQKWQSEATELMQKYPDFNLQEQLGNSNFSQLLKMGYPMENAYYAVMGAKMLQGAMERTATAVRQATANDIAAQGNRPRENATRNKASASVHNDVTKLTKADREALSRRALAGEIISFN